MIFILLGFGDKSLDKYVLAIDQNGCYAHIWENFGNLKQGTSKLGKASRTQGILIMFKWWSWVDLRMKRSTWPLCIDLAKFWKITFSWTIEGWCIIFGTFINATDICRFRYNDLYRNYTFFPHWDESHGIRLIIMV